MVSFYVRDRGGVEYDRGVLRSVDRIGNGARRVGIDKERCSIITSCLWKRGRSGRKDKKFLSEHFESSRRSTVQISCLREV